MSRSRTIELCCSLAVASSLAMPAMAVEPASVPTAAEPSSAAAEPSSVAAEPSSVAAEPSSVAAEPSSVAAEPSAPVVARPRVEHPSNNNKGIALIAIGAVFVFGGGHFVPSGLIWRFAARSKLDDLQRADAPAAEIEQAERRVEHATISVLVGAASVVVGLPMFIIGVVRQERGGTKTKIHAHRHRRRWTPSVGVGLGAATVGVHTRF